MADLHLPDHIRFCEIGDQRVFLDLRDDLYFQLPPDTDAVFSALRHDGGAEFGSEIDLLTAKGILVPAPAGIPIAPTRYPDPQGSLLENGEAGRGFSLPTLPEVFLLVAWAKRAVRKRRLPRLLGPRGGRPRRSNCPIARRDQAVGEFIRARRMVPIAPNCLYDSLALHRFLRRRSIEANLVIGAKLHPFAAHCWLQDGTTVLNDSLAVARGFAPILVA